MRRRGTRGQALVIAIFILAFLTAIAIALFTSTRLQLRRAFNVSNRVQAAQTAEAGIAMAQAFLRHDGSIHPTYTSYDFAFKTYFNGAAFAGKDWAFPNGVSWLNGGTDPVPLIFGDVAETLGDGLYIPREQGADPTVDPLADFVVQQPYDYYNPPDPPGLTPVEQIDKWADVDNNEDGYKDSIWLPLPRDMFFLTDGIDNDLDGLVDEGPGMGDDGVDNNSNGIVDGTTEVTLAANHSPERGIFCYYNENEGRLMLTAPLLAPDGTPLPAIDVRVDPNAADFPTALLPSVNGVPPNATVSVDPGNPDHIDGIDNDYDLVVDGHGWHYIVSPINSPSVLDDFHDEVMQRSTWPRGVDRVQGANPVYAGYYGPYLTSDYPDLYRDPEDPTQPYDPPMPLVLTSTGEPVCEVVGRVAVHIEDATAKANLNLVNGYAPEFSSYNEDRMTAGTGSSGRIPPITRNLGLGLDPSEWDARVLPNMGPLTAENIAQIRTGAPPGEELSVYTSPPFPGPEPPPPANPFEYDWGFPGYGRVDDNGNALWASIVGIDYNNSGWPYDGIIPYDYDLDGAFEFPNLQGVDEPQEYFPFRPKRNFVAENNTDGVGNPIDDDLDGLANEFGELGDWYYRTNRQLPIVDGIAATISRKLRPLTIAHSFGHGDRFSYFDNFGELRDEPTLTGLRLDYNYALADQIKDMLSRDWGYTIGARLNPLVDWFVAALVADGVPPLDAEDQADELAGFSLGLLRENVAVEPGPFDLTISYPPIGILAGLIDGDPATDYPDRFPADTGVRALQLAANLVDQRDPDHARTTLSDTVFDLWWQDVLGGDLREIEYTASGTESIRINELMVRPVRRIEAEATVADGAAVVDVDNPRTIADFFGAMFKIDPANPPAYSLYRDPNYFAYTHPVNVHVPDFMMLAENYDTHVDYLGTIADFQNDTGLRVTDLASGWAMQSSTTPAFLGDTANVATDEAYLEYTGPDANDPDVNPLLGLPQPPPDVVQFLFAPSAALPPGRYYMIVNISAEDSDGNAIDPAAYHLEYAVKYCQRITTPPTAPVYPDDYPLFNGKRADYDDVIYDVFNQYFPADAATPNPAVPWQEIDPYAMGDVIKAPDEPRLEGKVFLPTRLVRNPAPEIPGYEQDDAYTVEIPPVAADAADQVFLCVAFKMGTVDPDLASIAINFFEFSQEPDHEWIELTNIAEPPDYADLRNPDLMGATVDDVERSRWAEKASVDVSGWQIEIGAEGRSDNTILRIPDGTYIAPGGSIIVGVNKYDQFDPLAPDYLDPTLPDTPLIYQNGIGLASGTDPLWLTYVSPPPIPNPVLTPGLDSVFYRGAALPDFVDYNGNNVPDAAEAPYLDTDNDDVPDNIWDNLLQSTLDPVTGLAGPAKPWDRIVEAEVIIGSADENVLDSGDAGLADTVAGTFIPLPEPLGAPGEYVGMFLGQGTFYWRIVANTGITLTLDAYPDDFVNLSNGPWRILREPPRALGYLGTVTEIRDLAKLVLRGGIFPNYPEHDGIDNDGDNLILSNDGIDNDGDEISMITDGVDNDSDNLLLMIDGIDNDFDGTIDEIDEGIDEPGEGIDEAGEGFDEGRPERWLNNQYSVPGDYSIYSLAHYMDPARFNPGDPTDSTQDYPVDDPDPGGLGVYPRYLGSWMDHPEWKAFVERRMFPGDVVPVTLYEGPVDSRKIVDRVTYTEKDVVNRAIDDVLDYPALFDEVGDPVAFNLYFYAGVPETFNARPVLDPRFPTFWPDDTMGVDFYRSIPRKHPFYTGDRFGVANRWTAADGAYDDWAPSFGPIKYDGTHWLFDIDPAIAAAKAQAYGHAFSGTPLRRNVFENLVNAAFDPLDPDVLNPGLLAPKWDADFGAWGLGWQGVRNRAFASVQQVLEMPHLMMREELSTGPDIAFTQNAAERALLGQPELEAYNPATDSDGPQNTDTVALTTNMGSDPLVLTCAQADFYPLFPSPNDIEDAEGTEDYHKWGVGKTYLPNTWVPIFLHSLGETVSFPGTDMIFDAPPNIPPYWEPASNFGAVADWRVQMNFLLAEPANYPLGAYPAAFTGDPARWPLWKRPVMYVSGNMPNFDPAMSRADIEIADFEEKPAEALFVWDAEDGLEDGEYDAYVITAGAELNLLGWGQEIANSRADLTDLIEPGFGPAFLDALNTDGVYLSELAMDVEFFTDRGFDLIDPATGESEGTWAHGYGDGKVWDDEIDPLVADIGVRDALVTPNYFPEPGELLRGEEGEYIGESFGMRYGMTPNPEGIIHYGLVKVENGYLALFLRNWAASGKLNRFSRVVLAPRARSHGRININTAQMTIANGNGYNPLMGIPGVLAGYDAVNGVFSFLADTANYGPGDLNDARNLAASLVARRYEWPDGRYYRALGDLVVYDADTLGSPEGAAGVPPLNATDMDGDGLLVDAPEDDFFEQMWRYGRMANMITGHSDVFEIIVTAESGYISVEDMNNDNHRDWRYDFVTTAQKKVRTIYER